MSKAASDQHARLRAWLITDAKTGSDRQAEGVAHSLGCVADLKHAKPSLIYGMMAPYGWPDPLERFGEPDSRFAPPWPDLAIAVGRRSAPYVRALKRAAGGQTFTVFILDPRAGTGIADLICVPEHDALRGANVFTTPTSPHPFGARRLRDLRADVALDIAALPRPRIAVMLGGRSRHYPYSDADHARLSRALAALAQSGASFLVTGSRRTHDALTAAVEGALAGAPALFNRGEINRYPEFLAHADRIIVTGDSVNMTSEAAATGRPIYVFAPSGGKGKFDRFHAVLQQYGATRPLPETPDGFPDWRYEPIDSTVLIAEEIRTRLAAFRAA